VNKDLLQILKYDASSFVDDKIVKIICSLDYPVSTNALCILTGLSRQRVFKRLRKLSKFKEVQKVTTKPTDYWKIGVGIND